MDVPVPRRPGTDESGHPAGAGAPVDGGMNPALYGSPAHASNSMEKSMARTCLVSVPMEM